MQHRSELLFDSQGGNVLYCTVHPTAQPRLDLVMTFQAVYLLISTLEGAGKRGRPIKSWNDYVRKDLDSLGLALTWWKRCQDRPSWKAVIETLLRRT